LIQLDAAIDAGARYLVIPETGRWWLDYYDEFADYLRACCRSMIDEPDIGVIFELPASGVGKEPEAQGTEGPR